MDQQAAQAGFVAALDEFVVACEQFVERWSGPVDPAPQEPQPQERPADE